MSVNNDDDGDSNLVDADLAHRLNCTVIGKLILINPDVLGFALQYFQVYPAPFEDPPRDCNESKTKRIKLRRTFREVTDYEIVEACFNILQASPEFFKHRWNWSKFCKYLKRGDDKVKWMATKCIGIVLGLSESSQLKCASTLIKDLQKFMVDFKVKGGSNEDTLKNSLQKTKEIAKTVQSVITVAGVLLPVFNDQFKNEESNLVDVPSMNENLRSLALAVASRKCVCLQGTVGCGKTAIVEHLAKITGHGPSDFIKVQLGDQTDSKMLLGTYRCTDIPGEFVWQPGVLTQAVTFGKWLLLEDIDSAALDVASVLSNLMETGTLSVPGYKETVHVKSGFQLFVTQRLISSVSGFHKQTSGTTSLLEKHWLCINVEPLSKEELITVVKTLFPVLTTTATRIIDVFLLFSVGNHEMNSSYGSENAILKTDRLISTRDLIKWCSRTAKDFDVSSQKSKLKLLQDAIDIFCCSVSNQEHRLKLAIEIANKLGIEKTRAEYYSETHKPSISLNHEYFEGGRSILVRKNVNSMQIEQNFTKFSFTRPSACLLERITSCVAQNEPVLLVGETGTGKTSSVQYLARSTGHKLIVINMNQQSESADLLGGYKPVDLKFLIKPIREEFEILFRSYFAVEPNKKFLSHINLCFQKSKWKTLVALMSTSTNAAIKRLRSSETQMNGHSPLDPKEAKNRDLLKSWETLAVKLEKLTSQVKTQLSLAFAFIEGSLIKALKEGHWVLLDEINLANAETLECLSGLLEGSSGSLSLLERGDKEAISRHQDFTIFACMNPATDVGKKELPLGLRNRFTEFYVDELTESSDLQLLVGSYLESLNLPSNKIHSIVKFYSQVRSQAMMKLSDGTAHKPHYSLRTLCRALSVAAGNPCGIVLRSLYEAFCLSFLTQLDSKSYTVVEEMIKLTFFENEKNKDNKDKKKDKSVLNSKIPKPRSILNEDYIEFEGYWVVKGSLEPKIPENYILTPTVRRNLRDVARVVSIGKMPLLLQGDTSVGKTSLITYLAKASGHECVRINNHEHTDLQEYVGSYVADENGTLVFKEGILVKAMRKGYWIILDELNLAPSDVLEALNRVLDDNRELFIPETQQTVRAHENFMLFATQNPPGVYGGRKFLSRAFRNRFVELHFDEIPAPELETILEQRCSLPKKYCQQIISVMTDLQLRRKSTAAFAGKQGFMTLRDLFRWGERYRLAPAREDYYDFKQHLADEGYLVLAAKVRRAEEAQEIREVIKKRLQCDVDPENLFTLSEKTSPVTRSILEAIKLKDDSPFKHVVWTYHMRRMAVLVEKSYQFKEPVLLVGETGGGKTTICQLTAFLNNRNLYVVNCHMHTESSDFLGNLRPVRHQESDEEKNQKLFEWVDGPLIKAMQNGDFFLADEISLADDSVLERLNSLLEPERSLLLAEKGIDVGKDVDDVKNIIQANESFFFISTMNPGGDYGKKELSPALRNRFTEIWCDGCTERKDLQAIIEHNLSIVGSTRTSLATCILDFVEWLSTSDVGKRLTVSIRDVLSWVNFINVCITENDNCKLNLLDAYYHGACLTYIDSLGSGLTSMESAEKIKIFKETAFAFLRKQIEESLKNSFDQSMEVDSEELETPENMFGMHPFFISKGPVHVEEEVNSNFTFQAPTTKLNCLKLMRALQLRKPILLEGSPGVGKTSLVTALAKASGHTCLRINLSDQTDVSDLFGADLPVEGGKGGEFAWKDGPFLRALRAGHWILLDELNLASQSVLEGLNACFDHRGEIYIPELAKSFTVKPNTKLFACQNPLRQGGARRGLPKSFLNRFTQVFVDALTDSDLEFIVASQFPVITEFVIKRMIAFNSKLSEDTGISWGFSGAPWEMNLRDVTRWCEATIALAEKINNGQKVYNPGTSVELVYVDRMRTKEDKDKVREIYKEIFPEETYSILLSPVVHITDDSVYFGKIALQRTDTSIYTDQNLLILRDQLTTLRSLAQCVQMNWMSILVGGSGCGKSSVVRVLAQMAGQKLKSLVVNSAMDTTEILGGFEQTDYNRHLENLAEKTENLLTHRLRTKVCKENICQIAKYQALIERVRELSHDDYESVTMAMATKLFLDKIDRLLELLLEIKDFESSVEEELEKIEQDLVKLKGLVEEDNCLNAGGKFEWVDSILVKCLQEGTWLIIDQVNLCSPAVLDRLNGLLEPNGVLSIGERGVDSDGNIVTVKPHKNFRLFLTMDPKYGEISRAMRNRGVEIYMLNYNENPESGRLDYRSLLNNCGMTKRNHQEALMTVHKRLSEDSSNVDKLNIIQLLHATFLVVQQLAHGFPVLKAFKSACVDVYQKARFIYHPETKLRLLSIIDDTISEFDVELDNYYTIDLDAATCSIKNLQDNSKLTLIRQQGLLMDWCVKEYLLTERQFSNSEAKVSCKMNFVDDLFNLEDNSSKEVLDILPYVLLNFYELSTLSDTSIRKAWASKVLTLSPNLKFLDEKNFILAEDVLSFDYEGFNSKMPWGKEFEKANNLALLLYFEMLVMNSVTKSDWKIDNRSNTITVAQFSEAHRQGNLAIRLDNKNHHTIVTNYVTFLLQVKTCIYTILKNSVNEIDDGEYVFLRHGLKKFSRFCDLGRMILITKHSESLFENENEIVLLLKVHYRWLKKFINYLTDNYEVNESSNFYEHHETLNEIMEEIDSILVSDNDLFRKICKFYKKTIELPLPRTTSLVLELFSGLQRITDSFTPFKNKYMSKNLLTEPKFKTFQKQETLEIRSTLISLWHKIYMNETLEQDVINNLDLIKKFCDKYLAESENFEQDHSELQLETLSSKEIEKMATKIQMWPLHEYMFILFVGQLQRKICEKVYEKNDANHLPSAYPSAYHLEIPNIPIELHAVLNTIFVQQNQPEERNRLIYALITCFSKFSESSYAINGFKQVTHWKNFDLEDDVKSDNSGIYNPVNLSSGPILVGLISELLLNKSRKSSLDKSNFASVATLGSYQPRIDQLKTIKDILWKNSVAINSKQFDQTSNDFQTLHCLLQSFLATCKIVQADPKLKKIFESNKDESKFAVEYLQPLKDLQNISELLESNRDNHNRGQAWAILGYLQTFIFSNIGYIDPVQKVALKLRYVEEDIEDCDNTIYVANLYSRIYGLTNDSILNPRLAKMKDSFEYLEKEKKSLQNTKAVRPTNSEFIALSKKFSSFRTDIGSYTKMNKLVQRLIKTTSELEKEVSNLRIKNVELGKVEAENWLSSVKSFMEEVESRFLAGYPDIVYPNLAGLAQMRHGIQLLVEESSRLLSLAKLNRDSSEVESFICNLVRFPSLSSDQESLLNLVNLCTSHKTRELLSASLTSKDNTIILQEQFRLMITGLSEFYNYIVLKGNMTRDLWNKLNDYLQQIVLIWRQQEQEIEKRQLEKESQYKNKTVTKAATLTEEEETAQELLKLFPTHHEHDFVDIDQKSYDFVTKENTENKEKEKEDNIDLSCLITENEIKVVQNIHSTIVKSFTNSEWLCKNTENLQPDFIEPFLQRYNTFSLLSDNIASALSNDMTKKLYTSLNVLTQAVIKVSQGERLSYNLHISKEADKTYDYYKDSNVEEVKQCKLLLENILNRILGLLKEFPENPNLVDIKIIVQRIFSFPMISPLSRFLFGLELLLAKLHNWETVAHLGVSMQEYILALTQQILSWRKLELACWKDCLNATELRLKSQTSKWWFFLYDLFQSYSMKQEITETDEKKPDEEIITLEKLIESLEKFMRESSLVEFEPRLELLLTFHCHFYYMNPSNKRDELLAITWNLFNTYNQFLPTIKERIDVVKKPIETKAKGFINIEKWNDISYWSVKETVTKTHKALHKFIKEYEKSLKEPVTPCLIVKPSYKNYQSANEKESVGNNSENTSKVNPDPFIVSVSNSSEESLVAKSKLILAADTHYLTRAKQLCRDIISSSQYPKVRVSIEAEFIGEFIDWSNRLRLSEVDRTLPLPKQKSMATSMMNEKRRALADYFKTLTTYGISYRTGNNTWKNNFEKVLDLTIPPVEVKAAVKSKNLSVAEEMLLNQWEGCDRYYYGSQIKLFALIESFLSKKTDIGAQNVEKCQGFSVHLMLMANTQKNTLAEVMKYFVGLKSLVSEMSKINTSSCITIRLNDLQIEAKKLREFLTVLQTSFEHILIYLDACPTDFQVEGEDNSYSLLSKNSEIVNCKKGDIIWNTANSQVKECLSTVIDITKKFDVMFPEFLIVYDENKYPNQQIELLTSNHVKFLTESFISLKNINEKMREFSKMLVSSEDEHHPLLENIVFLETNINKKLNEFEKIDVPLEESESESELKIENLDAYEKDLHQLLNEILIIIQKKYKKVDKSTTTNEKNEDDDEDENYDENEKNKLKEKLVESITLDINELKLKEIYTILNNLVKFIYDTNNASVQEYLSLLQKCLPLIQQYMLLVQYYINEQVASFRIICKILHTQLNVFLDLATNGFCKPKDLDLEGEEGSQEKTGGEGIGLADGEGKKDVSENIESEDQLEDAKPVGEQSEKPEDKECPEEDKGIEMSEDFEGKLQDVNKEDNEGKDNDESEDEDVEKQMGETGEGADKLDEEVWKEDEEEPQGEETEKNDDEVGRGEETGEKEFGASDENKKEDSDDKNESNDPDENQREQQKEINEMEEPQYDEDQVNAVHNNLPPEPEPEPLDLPDDINMDDEMKDGDEQQDEENPFDVDKMKEAMLPPETEEMEQSKEEETKDESEVKNDDSSDEETDNGSEKPGDQSENTKEDGNEEDTDVKVPEPKKENEEAGEKEEEEKSTENEEKSVSKDSESKEMDATDPIDQPQDGSRDQVANKAEAEQETSDESRPAENWQDEKKDRGMGQSEAEQHDAGHSGSSMEQTRTMPNQDVESQQTEKRKNPGQSDETHTLAEKIEPDKKKLKTMIHSKEKLPEEDNDEEGMEVDEKGEPDICQHVKEKEKFDHYAMDAATEEQSKEQASNVEQEKDLPTEEEKEEGMDIDMHEDVEVEVPDENILKQKPEKLHEEDSLKNKKDSKEKGRVDEGQLEAIVDVEGETVETMRVDRGAESAFFTNLTDIENDLSTKQNEIKRMEVEKMLSQWSNVPNTEEAVTAWNTLSSVTDPAARDLSEKLRLVLEPTQASRLKGDYRTGRRINMRKIIPYIASQFRKDKIWLRRTKPSKREYQIVLAIDDSSSMADNHSKELAFESLSLITKALTYLEAGQLSVLSFGEETNILHPLGETFSEQSGARLMQEIRFDQQKTMVGQLVEFATHMFQTQSNSIDNAKLMVIVSDGRNVFSEGEERVRSAIRKARLNDIFLVFIIIDNPVNKDSLLDVTTVTFGDKGLVKFSYMDRFPFPFYMILRDINSLPGVLSDALRQWFEVVGKIDS